MDDKPVWRTVREVLLARPAVTVEEALVSLVEPKVEAALAHWNVEVVGPTSWSGPRLAVMVRLVVDGVPLERTLTRFYRPTQSSRAHLVHAERSVSLEITGADGLAIRSALSIDNVR